MVGRLRAYLVRGRDILASEGLKTMLVRGFDYFRRRTFSWRRYYLYEHTLVDRDGAAFLPRFDSFDLRIVGSNKEAARLADETGIDIRRRFVRARYSLERGAVAFCVFVDGNLAHIGWAGMNREAKNMFDNLPYRVDFANGEACTGGTQTIRGYERRGLMGYVYFERLRYLKERGYRISRNAVEIGNTPSNRVQAKFGPKMYARALNIRIFCLNFWKEWPAEKNDDTG